MHWLGTNPSKSLSCGAGFGKYHESAVDATQSFVRLRERRDTSYSIIHAIKVSVTSVVTNTVIVW